MMYVVLIACLAACFSAPIDDPAWVKYKLKYKKVYAEEEDATRYETWIENKKKIDLHNNEYAATYEQGENQFTDMTDDEFNKKIGGCFKLPEEILNGSVSTQGKPFKRLPSNVQLPDTVNWVEKGYVTPVKNQGQCGSCYSFSATGALEGAWFKKTGRLPSLSEQQIVDCSGRYGNLGCGGGWYQDSWRYLKDAGGSESEKSYPYETRKYHCRFNRHQVVAQVKSYHDLAPEDEAELKEAVATVGPVSVAIDASRPSFRSYKHGVYYDQWCRKRLRNLNHAVLVVGYGTEGGYHYWLVKNSWGTWFGDGGYIKMIRNYYNHCGIATKPSYPIV